MKAYQHRFYTSEVEKITELLTMVGKENIIAINTVNNNGFEITYIWYWA